jgi:hypothetical protein
MADEPTTKAKAGDKDRAAKIEPSVTLQEWARRNQSERVDGMDRPVRELVAGFVHEETQAGRRVGKASEFTERFASFRTRKAQ